ncbi:hypothetical protein FQA39_LY02420 [Lamprigera yunnana]|nr:hypothetical protein FQA39_LY02420 [Lamprigera yunnana]
MQLRSDLIVARKKELQNIIDNFIEISNDGLEFLGANSLDDPEFILETDDENLSIPSMENIEEKNFYENIVKQDQIENQVDTKSTKSNKESLDIMWKAFCGTDSDVFAQFLQLNTICECFSYFITDKLNVKPNNHVYPDNKWTLANLYI